MGNSILIGCGSHNTTFSLILKFHSFIGGFNGNKIHMYRSTCKQPTYVRYTLVHIGWKRMPSCERGNRNPCVQKKLHLQFMHVPLITHVQLEWLCISNFFLLEIFPSVADKLKQTQPFVVGHVISNMSSSTACVKRLCQQQTTSWWLNRPISKMFQIGSFPQG